MHQDTQSKAKLTQACVCVCVGFFEVKRLWRNAMSRKNWNFNSIENKFLTYDSHLFLVSDISNTQQWQQSANGAEIQLLAHGGGEAGAIRMSPAGAGTDERAGWGASEDASTGAGGFVREHKTQRGSNEQQKEAGVVSSDA